jgi:hypothetical protein
MQLTLINHFLHIMCRISTEMMRNLKKKLILVCEAIGTAATPGL